MTSETLANTIRSRFATQVATPQSLTTIYDNDPSAPVTTGGTWCRLTVMDGESRRITIGVKEYRTVGVMIAQLFDGIGNGTKGLRVLADAIVTAFRDISASSVKYGTPTINNIGVLNGKYQVNVVVPFQADTVEA